MFSITPFSYKTVSVSYSDIVSSLRLNIEWEQHIIYDGRDDRDESYPSLHRA